MTAILHASHDQPSTWVARFAPLMMQGDVLDLACGSGRHARLLAGLGHRVLAVDRDPASLERAKGPGICTLQHDLENAADGQAGWPFEPGRFAGIVVTNYLHRPLFRHILASLAPNGVLIYETFARGNERFGKPSNPDFLLAPGELLDVVQAEPARLRVIAFEDGYIAAPKPVMLQRICVLAGDADATPERLRLI
jgi:SAM-dependent methyltransferase